MITKHNSLIEAKYKLSLVEQRLIFLAISRINPLISSKIKPSEQQEFEFTVAEYAEFYGIDLKIAYEQTKEAVEHLYERSVLTENTKFKKKFRWVSSQTYFKNEGRFSINFTKDVMPYLTQLENQFTHYCLKNIAKFKSSYTIRIYELMCQYKELGERTLKLDNLKEMLQVAENKSYGRFNTFNQRVLEPAIKEINQNSNLNISVEKITRGRKVDSLYFKIDPGIPESPRLPRRPQVIKGSAKEGEWAKRCIDKLLDHKTKLESIGQKLDMKDLKKLRDFYEILGDWYQIEHINAAINKRLGKIIQKQEQEHDDGFKSTGQIII